MNLPAWVENKRVRCGNDLLFKALSIAWEALESIDKQKAGCDHRLTAKDAMRRIEEMA